MSRALATELGFDWLSKDEVKEALMDQLGTPDTVPASRRLGRAAVAAVLRLARGCRAAVIDSTWYPYAVPMVQALPGPFVEVRCVVPGAIARRRYAERSRDVRHLDRLRNPEELWGEPVAPLGVGPVIQVDTTGPVDTAALAEQVRVALRSPTWVGTTWWSPP